MNLTRSQTARLIPKINWILYTSNEKSENKIKKNHSTQNSSEKIIHIGINLTQDAQDLYTEAIKYWHNK